MEYRCQLEVRCWAMDITKLDHKETLGFTKVNEGDSLVAIYPPTAGKGVHVSALKTVTASSIGASAGAKNYVPF